MNKLNDFIKKHEVMAALLFSGGVLIFMFLFLPWMYKTYVLKEGYLGLGFIIYITLVAGLLLGYRSGRKKGYKEGHAVGESYGRKDVLEGLEEEDLEYIYLGEKTYKIQKDNSKNPNVKQ